MKFYVENWILCLFIISLLIVSNSSSVLEGINFTPSDKLSDIVANPNEIVEMNNISESDQRVEIDLSENDPLEYMKRKEELINLYLKAKPGRLRFKQIPQEKISSIKLEEQKQLNIYVTKPGSVGKKGDPFNKEYHSQEEVVKIIRVEAASYPDTSKNSAGDKFIAENVLKDDSGFWCSHGGHGIMEEVQFLIQFENSYRLSAFWIHWAFAPGQYKVSIANEKLNEGFKWDTLIDWKNSVKSGTTNWWRSVIANPKTRWKYKSFDERVNLDEPTWAKYVLLEMRLPVNQYYGIYKLEFYMKSKAVVMLKSRLPGEETCLSVVNGEITNYSPVVMIDCLQGISYGDNRDLFVLHSNGFITTYKENKCLQSPTASRVDVLDCGKSSDFKDDREKWIIEYDGKIRSMKEEFTCLSVTDFSVKDDVPLEELKSSASSSQMDGLHGPEKAINDDVNTYWASIPTISPVIFEIFFSKYSYFLKDMLIDWKFPAKSFSIYGLFTDGYWRVFKTMTDNRETSTTVNLKNRDLMGIRITMTESSTKVEEKYVYGIKTISLRTGGRFLRRDACKHVILNANKFEIIDVSILDQVTGFEFKKAIAGLHKTRTKMRLIKELFKKVPDTILNLRETSSIISNKIHNIHEKLSDFRLKFKKFDEFLKSDQMKIFSIATTEHAPAYSCAHIIKAFPSKRSGMYWIKNDCMPKAQHVYCDFDSYDKKGGLDYLIYNENQNSNTHMKTKFNSHHDIKYKCYELGMEPIEIKNPAMLKNVHNLLEILDFDLHSNFIIPIGYDYNCDTSKCSSIFRSLNNQNSGDITDMINSLNESSSTVINNLFTPISTLETNNRNLAAFGKHGNIVYESIQNSKISAIVCSTNKDGSMISKNYLEADCETNLRGEDFSHNEVFSILRMNCPSDCSKSKKAAVFGTDIYTDNSSVCRAAVHSGAKKDGEEKIVEVQLQPGRDKYLGLERYSVVSLDYPEKWSRSFKVSKYVPHCPIDTMQDYNSPNEDEQTESQGESSSFLEIDTKVYPDKDLLSQLQEKMQEVELVKRVQKVIDDYQHLVEQDRSILANKKQRNLVTKLGEISRFLQEDISNKIGNKVEETNQEYSHIRSNSVSSNNLQNSYKTGPGTLEKMRLLAKNSLNSSTVNKVLNENNFFEPGSLGKNGLKTGSSTSSDVTLANAMKQTLDKINQEKEAEKFKNFLSIHLPTSHTTTEIGLTYISALFEAEKKEYSEVKKLSDDFKGIIGKTILETEKLNNDKNSGILVQTDQFSDDENRSNAVLKFIYEVDRKIQNKLKQTEYKVKLARNKLDNHNIREPFTEDYNTKNILENWSFYTSKKGKGEPPSWEYFQYYINGHFKVIQHKGGFMDNRSGAHLILNNRNFYDFEFKCSILLKDNNTFGVAFRYIDSYNYYVFEVTNQEGGTKRVRKFSRGVPFVLEYKNDGGYIQDTWYNIKIRAQQSQFLVYMTDYNGPDLESHYELQFKMTDNELVHGTVALTSMGMAYSLIDNISIVPIECTNFDDISSKASTLTPTCSRFRETFKNGFNYRWKSIDPLDSLDGPSVWKTTNDFADREIVLAQLSLIGGTSEFQEGSLFILNQASKICNIGRFMVKLKALDQGIVGLIFRYDKNDNDLGSANYYILEISGIQGSKFIRLRKKIGDKFILVSSNPTLGYEQNQWFKIILTMENDQFNAFITENSSQDNITKIFPDGVRDSDIKFGLLGLSTYKTKAIFEEILLSPFDNLDQPKNEEDMLYVDEEELELPQNKLKDSTIFDRVNIHIKNFSWSKCLVYPIVEDRKRYCNVLFSSSVEIENCQSNFCESCCNKTVDSTNKEHNFLCSKQCSIIEVGSKNNTWESCIESEHPERSIYPYCDEHFQKDFYHRQRCKVDMCNLCCVSVDHGEKPNITDNNLHKCYSKCAKSKS